MAKSGISKFFKWLGISVGVLILLLVILFFSINERLPEGKEGPEAEQMAARMLRAINKPAWDSTKYVQWTFKGMHSFLWDKQRHLTKVTWEDYEVLLDINAIGGLAKKGGQVLPADEAKLIIRSAWEFWCNDSFWLNAPSKIMDAGTKRSVVKYKGKDALMVTYESGGVTPGDSYLWLMDDNGLPTAYKMWVKIIPVGGVEFSWEKWKTLATGTRIATFHDGSLLNIDISDLKAGNSLETMELNTDPFAVLK